MAPGLPPATMTFLELMRHPGHAAIDAVHGASRTTCIVGQSRGETRIRRFRIGAVEIAGQDQAHPRGCMPPGVGSVAWSGGAWARLRCDRRNRAPIAALNGGLAVWLPGDGPQALARYDSMGQGPATTGGRQVVVRPTPRMLVVLDLSNPGRCDGLAVRQLVPSQGGWRSMLP